MSENETKYTGGNGHGASVQIPETIDQAHEHLGHTAPRVTPADIEASIVSEHFVNGADVVPNVDVFPQLKLLTLCICVMRNGFVIVGKSAPASPENFNLELGMRFAREDARKQIWPLMGYALRERLALVAEAQQQRQDER